jgi:sterol desaturase/sphingolipid hydroxylase (fatty acid hydroxylase superfamily)
MSVNHLSRRLPKSINGRSFAEEYLTWIVAPMPFLLPWVAVESAGVSSLGGALDAVLFSPRIWVSDTFFERLRANVILWLLSYGTAWIVFQLARLSPSTARFKFNPKAPPRSMVLSEMTRSFGGIAILTAYQVWLVPLDPSGPLATSAAGKVGWLVFVMLWADLHFYASHRLLHAYKPLYRYVHKVHHRSHNTDPWSGLSMHPIEQLIYFSAMLVGCLPGLGAVVPFWVTHALSVGLIVYPIPAHIGYWPFERHHWEHHTKFNYNYGSSVLWDVLLGTTFEAYSAERAARMTASEKARAAEGKRQREATLGKTQE